MTRNTFLVAFLTILLVGSLMACIGPTPSTKEDLNRGHNKSLVVLPFRDSTTGCYGVLVATPAYSEGGVIGRCP